jgi:AcrR family transcriptional regulator
MDPKSPSDSGPAPRTSAPGDAAPRRARYTAAAARVVHEHGTGGATVARIVALAGGSRAGFYELFSSARECLRAALEEALERLFEPFRAPADGEWAARLREAIGRYYAAAEPDLAELALVHWAAIEAPGEGRLDAAVGDLAGLLRSGRPPSAPGSGPQQASTLDDCLACAVVMQPARRLRSREIAGLEAERDEVLEVLSIYYPLAGAAPG